MDDQQQQELLISLKQCVLFYGQDSKKNHVSCSTVITHKHTEPQQETTMQIHKIKQQIVREVVNSLFWHHHRRRRRCRRRQPQ